MKGQDINAIIKGGATASSAPAVESKTDVKKDDKKDDKKAPEKKAPAPKAVSVKALVAALEAKLAAKAESDLEKARAKFVSNWAKKRAAANKKRIAAAAKKAAAKAKVAAKKAAAKAKVAARKAAAKAKASANPVTIFAIITVKSKMVKKMMKKLTTPTMELFT